MEEKFEQCRGIQPTLRFYFLGASHKRECENLAGEMLELLIEEGLCSAWGQEVRLGECLPDGLDMDLSLSGASLSELLSEEKLIDIVEKISRLPAYISLRDKTVRLSPQMEPSVWFSYCSFGRGFYADNIADEPVVVYNMGLDGIHFS